MTDIVVESDAPEETRALAARLAKRLAPGTVLAMEGNLGSGKTCFVKGLARGLSIREPVTSPTFTIVHEHRGRLPLYHIDLYRIRSEDEALALGIEEYLESDGVAAIEWSERIANLLTETTVHVRFTRTGPETRHIVLSGPASLLVHLAADD